MIHISDTHGRHRQITGLPDADIIVHSGDFTMAGTEEETFDFINWFCDLPYRQKIFVAGNHDDCLYGSVLSGLDENCHYLCNSGISIDGVIFYGVPLFVEDALSGNNKAFIQVIPKDTDVLITHQPPMGILDFDGAHHYGSSDLLKTIEIIKPKYHLFGHIHAAFGTETHDEVQFSNAALVDEEYNLLPERCESLPVNLI